VNKAEIIATELWLKDRLLAELVADYIYAFRDGDNLIGIK